MTTASLRIIPAREEHVSIILDLIKALADYEKLSHQVVATEDDVRRWLFGTRPAAETILAYVGDEAVGFALFFQNFSTFLGRPGLYLEDLFVRPEWRRHGIGKRLLERLAAIAVERGYGRVEWAVLDWNTPSIDFYRSLGAVPLDDWTVFRLTGDALTRVADPSSPASVDGR
jgi:GNAT superfamily N-acetyltransferase